MHRYFVRLENCRHRWPYRLLAQLGLDPDAARLERLALDRAGDPQDRVLRPRADALHPGQRARAVEGERHALAAPALVRREPGRPERLAARERRRRRALRYLPLATHERRRVGARERVLDVAKRFPDRLRIELDALATRVLFDDDQRAIGVEYLKGRHLYRAHARPSPHAGERREMRASREVILSGGAFNTPQLLMLSGIGPRAELERHGIPVRVDLGGVGRNLQDRYEVGVVHRMDFEHWRVLRGRPLRQERPAVPALGSRLGRRLLDERLGDGRRLAVAAARGRCPTSSASRCSATSTATSRATPACSRSTSTTSPGPSTRATPAIAAGEVRLRSADPRDPPHVNFRYFDEGSDGAAEDLESVVEGIRLVQGADGPAQEARAGGAGGDAGRRASSRRAELQEFVKRNAWGHHASCTCAIGPRGRWRRADERLPGPWHARPAGGGRVRLPPHTRLLSGRSDLHDRREGRRRDPGECE